MSSETDQYHFYLKFIKPMVLNLPDAKDRATAALWLKKLGEINAQNPENDLHIKYLILLLFALHEKKLSGIFEKPPPEESLEPFPEDHTIVDMIYLVKSKETKETKFPSINSSVSADLCEFVSVQEIPNFGIQGYYAVSTEPLTRWIKPTTGKPVMHVPCYKDTCTLSKLSNYKKHAASSRGQTVDPSDATLTPNDQIDESTKDQQPKSVAPGDSTADWTGFSQRFTKMEMPFLESRPCWGTNRYIERLIDQSPHVVGDLELSEADAVLHLFKDRKMKVVKKSSVTGLCHVSSKRREIERMMDLPPCAHDPGEPESSSEDSIKAHSCLPKDKDVIDIRCADYCIADNEHPFKRPGKVIGISSKSPKMLENLIMSKRSSAAEKLPNTKHDNKIKRMEIDDEYSDWVSEMPEVGQVASPNGSPRSRPSRSVEENSVHGRRLSGHIPPPPPLSAHPPQFLRSSRPPVSPLATPIPQPPPLPPAPSVPQPTIRHRVTKRKSPEPQHSYRQSIDPVRGIHEPSLREQRLTLPHYVGVRSPRRSSLTSSLTRKPYPKLDMDFEAYNGVIQPDANVSHFLHQSPSITSRSSSQREVDEEFEMFLSRGSDPEANVSFAEKSAEDSLNRGQKSPNSITSGDSYVSLQFVEQSTNERRRSFHKMGADDSYFPPGSSYRFEGDKFIKSSPSSVDASAFIPLPTVYGSSLEAPAFANADTSWEDQKTERDRRKLLKSPSASTSRSLSDIDDDLDEFVPTLHSTFSEN